MYIMHDDNHSTQLVAFRKIAKWGHLVKMEIGGGTKVESCVHCRISSGGIWVSRGGQCPPPPPPECNPDLPVYRPKVAIPRPCFDSIKLVKLLGTYSAYPVESICLESYTEPAWSTS